MLFATPLIRATLLRRYKRFLADAALADGEVVVAHCPNPGSMLSLVEPGAEIWLSPASGPNRTLRYGWELVRARGHLVGVNTARTNALVAEALAADAIPELAGYGRARREVRLGDASRADFLLEQTGRAPCWVEVKNVTMRRGSGVDPVEFPDCVTARGKKHLLELRKEVQSGNRAVMVFVAQRGDGDRLRIAADLDPAYAEAFAAARAGGVEMLAYRCAVSTSAILLTEAIAIVDGAAPPRTTVTALEDS